jgi:hypothetical protein
MERGGGDAGVWILRGFDVVAWFDPNRPPNALVEPTGSLNRRADAVVPLSE